MEQKFYSKDLVTDGAHGDSDLAGTAGEGIRTWDKLIENNDNDNSDALGDGLDLDNDVFVPSIKWYTLFSVFYSMYPNKPRPEPSLPQGLAQTINEGLA